ncbi:response regulator transcription factor [Streptomyces sp. XY006]|uniref:response regulator transcription factor n=1 Tax=Streptomyces sp. XY006 TaxID=2021410 RepID=UPI00211B0799|nr:response regulator transcription factor [Streptomyces sp. XY006]
MSPAARRSSDPGSPSASCPTSPRRPPARSALPFPHLTDRERETLDLISRGLDNASIARRLNLSEKTVRNRVSDVLAKLHARSRTEAAALARDAGLGHPRPSGEKSTRLSGPAGPGSSP